MTIRHPVLEICSVIKDQQVDRLGRQITEHARGRQSQESGLELRGAENDRNRGGSEGDLRRREERGEP